MERMIDTLEVGEVHNTGDDFYFKLNDHTVINTIPAVHILQGKMSKEIMDNVYEYLDTINDNSANPTLVANISGDQSTVNVKHPLMQGYMRQLHQSAVDFHNLHPHPQLEFTKSPERRIEVSHSWSVKMNGGDYNPRHYHQTRNSVTGIATVCYVKVPESIQTDVDASNKKVYKTGNSTYTRNEGCLDFSWNRQSMMDDYRSRDTTTVVPHVGDYYIFPKWLYHTVYPYTGSEQRWSVQTNFNVFTNEEWEMTKNA